MSDKKTLKTPKGLEIPIPTRSAFIRDLKKLAKVEKSPARRPKK